MYHTGKKENKSYKKERENVIPSKVRKNISKEFCIPFKKKKEAKSKTEIPLLQNYGSLNFEAPC